MGQHVRKILAVVPTGFCFGLQNAELALFSRLRSTMQCHFLITRWTDGEFTRRLDVLAIAHSSTWLGMFSRKLDWANLKMTLECLIRLPVAWWDFIRLYRSFRPHVVYLANHHELILLWPLLIWLRPKVVCHMHDPPPPILFQRYSFFVWRRAVARFLFISESARARLAQLGHLRPADIVIYNGVEVKPLALPRRRDGRFCELFGWSAEAIIFGISGQINPQKGHEDFIAAAAMAHRSNPMMRFVIGGRGTEQSLAPLGQLIADHGLDEIVGFCGWLPESDLFYEAIDVFVLASRHEEGFGLVVAEASERAIPVIATRSGGAIEILVDGETGMLVAKQNPVMMADAMNRLAASAALRAEIGKRGRDRIKSAFDLTVQAEKFATVVAELA